MPQDQPTDKGAIAIAGAILAVTSQRGPDKSTCPSEIARMLFPGDWRRQMKAVVETAIALHQQGKVVITQRGMPFDLFQINGPVRIKIV